MMVYVEQDDIISTSPGQHPEIHVGGKAEKFSVLLLIRCNLIPGVIPLARKSDIMSSTCFLSCAASFAQARMNSTCRDTLLIDHRKTLTQQFLT